MRAQSSFSLSEYGASLTLKHVVNLVGYRLRETGRPADLTRVSSSALQTRSSCDDSGVLCSVSEVCFDALCWVRELSLNARLLGREYPVTGSSLMVLLRSEE